MKDLSYMLVIIYDCLDGSWSHATYADHLLEDFLKQYPAPANAFHVGGPRDFFVIELADQVIASDEWFNKILFCKYFSNSVLC